MWPFNLRRYRVVFSDTFPTVPTSYQTNGPPPKPGDIISTPMGELRVVGIPMKARFGRTGTILAEAFKPRGQEPWFLTPLRKRFAGRLLQLQAGREARAAAQPRA